MNTKLFPCQFLKGKPVLPGDKSISHRTILFAALADGKSEISNILEGQDTLATLDCIRKLGVSVERISEKKYEIYGKGLQGLTLPRTNLNCENSGTTMRLLMGILAAQSFDSTLMGDESLSCRPMQRVADPLRKMGADIELYENNFAPVRIKGSKLSCVDYLLPIASAQIKSAILLAGLFVDGQNIVREKYKSRDHTERLLAYFGASITVEGTTVSIQGNQRLVRKKIVVPGDVSSAAFWAAAASFLPNSEVEFENVLLNPTRIGFLNVISSMGANVQSNILTFYPEPVGNLRVSTGNLNGISIGPEQIPAIIDELPLIAVLGAFANGKTEVRGAQELRFKETDRIEAITRNLMAMGVDVESREDGFCIYGPQPLHGAKINSFGDHRIAMAFSIAALGARGETEILGSDCVSVSYPGFYESLKKLSNG